MTAVVGIDPSLRATGIATPAGVCTIRSEGHEKDTLRQRADRLNKLAGQISLTVGSVLHDYADDVLVVIERQIATTGGHQHDRSGLWWLVVSEFVRWHGVDVVEVTPPQLKLYALGKGKGDKDEVMLAVARRYPDVPVSNNNESDALVLRAMGCDHLGAPLVPVPKTHRAALDKVRWPDPMRAAV